MAVEPVRPDQVASLKQKVYPEEVISAFNELIAKDYDGSAATVKQPEVVDLILKKLNPGAQPITITRNEIFKNNWLEVDEIYRKAGWSVKYEKPGFNESGDAFWVFTKKRGR